VGRNVTKEIGGPIGVFSALHHVFFEADSDPAEDFFARLKTGAELDRQDPVLRLRNQITRPRKDRGYTQSPHHIAALTVKAFNFRRAGRGVAALFYRANEKFPTLNPPSPDAPTDFVDPLHPGVDFASAPDGQPVEAQEQLPGVSIGR
jgi:hypothetical protein